jgi:hypothetical protein
MNLVFMSDEHREYFADMVSGDKQTDCIYYLLGADDTLRSHISDVLVDGELRKNALRDSWMTSFGKKCYALALNLLYGLTFPESEPAALFANTDDKVSEVLFEAIDIYRGGGGYDDNLVQGDWLHY